LSYAPVITGASFVCVAWRPCRCVEKLQGDKAVSSPARSTRRDPLQSIRNALFPHPNIGTDLLQRPASTPQGNDPPVTLLRLVRVETHSTVFAGHPAIIPLLKPATA
jgi:hypothetical protein